MKNLVFAVSLIIAVASTALITTNFTSQAQRTIAPAQNDALAVRVAELEKKVDQLQKEMAGAKLVTAGLDKSITSLKATFGSHTHKISASSYTFEQFRIESSQGKQLYVPIVNIDQLKANKGFLTSQPIP